MSSVSSASSTASNALRITGMATGLDTDTTVKQMLAGENAKLDKMKQNREYNEWKQEALRDIIKDFKSLRDDYLLASSSSSTNMIKSLNYSSATITTSGNYADAMTATALPGAAIGSSTVKVTQIAKSAKIEGRNLNSASISSGFDANDWKGKKITFTIDEVDYTATLDSTISNESDLVAAMNDAISKAVTDGTGSTELGTSKVIVSLSDDGNMSFQLGNGVSKATIKSTEISQLDSLVDKSLTNTNNTDIYFNPDDWSSKSIKFTVGNTDYNITLGTVSSESDLATAINAAISSNTSLNGDVIASVDTSSNTLILNTSGNSTVKVSSADISTNIADFANLKVLNPTASSTLADLGITSDSIKFAIKVGSTTSGTIELNSTDTLSSVINKIYGIKAKADDTSSSAATLYDSIKISFSELTKSLTMETRNTGNSQSLQIVPASSDDAGNLAKLGFTTSTNANENVATGQDAIVSIMPAGSTTATTVTKSSNSFTIDNINYNITKDPAETPYTVNLTTKADGQSGVDKIKGFIEKYNALVSKISTKLTEKKNYNYSPLTDAQKEEMEDDEIKTWETKAKQGILKNDTELQSILYNMRTAFTSGVTAAGLTLQEIGLDTYNGLEAITKPGQIRIVDEGKLKAALEERGDQVMKLFTASEPTDAEAAAAKPSNFTGTNEEWLKKYKYDNTGILQRLQSIIYNSAGKSDGALLQRAGYENTASATTNMLTKQLTKQDKAISEMKDKIYDKQERYYQMFAKLEAAMNTLNSQQSWLTQSLGN